MGSFHDKLHAFNFQGAERETFNLIKYKWTFNLIFLPTYCNIYFPVSSD